MSGSITKNYWEDHYSSGGISGQGSIGDCRKWKWDTIFSYVEKIDKVIDVGCGDLSFWDGETCKSYTGIDISPTIINKNMKARPDWNFICSDASISHPVHAPVVFCLDILFHILDDQVYLSILENLARYSDEWIFIYTWVNNPLLTLTLRKNLFLRSVKDLQLSRAIHFLTKRVESDDNYQKYRDFNQFVPLFSRMGFKLVSIEKCPVDKAGGMYIFRKQTGD